MSEAWDPRTLEALQAKALEALLKAVDLKELDTVRVAFLGKTGEITQLAKGLGKLSNEDRPKAGQEINQLKRTVEEHLKKRMDELKAEALTARLLAERIDVTLPARPTPQGVLHPVSQVIDEITAIFADMGFAVAEGPDIDDDFHNFTALNFPPSHPARAMHDTFFLEAEKDGEPLLLRTHTSTVQIRHMLANKPPHRIIVPGRVYRCDSDATHTPCFHQLEGLVIDRRTHFGHLKGCLIDFVRAFFEREDVPVRFRPSFFPFTEPSAEVDIGCKRSKDELIIGEGDDWLEILGCGMVHPNVLTAVGLDPAEWQGFAFGLGIDRIAMLKYGIPDLRTFFDGDLAWASHYGFDALDMPATHKGLSR